MASSAVSLLSFQLLLLLANGLSAASLQSSVQCFDAIFSFGDSLADTGNLLHSPLGENDNIGRLPYGETYFHRPTGRFSDGRVVVDFIAQAIGLPLLPPYLAGPGPDGHAFRQGVNFAVGGATALGNDFFREKGMVVGWTEYSLGVQIEWFKTLLPSICSDSDDESECRKTFEGSLFLMGEIGGNDYNSPFLQGWPFDEIQTFVPEVINSISSAINVLIELGARTLVVPGNLPFGCVPAYLTLFANTKTEEYDPRTGCISWLNDFSVYHNRLLQDELDRIRQRHPSATIIYADNYGVAMTIYGSPQKFGFGKTPFTACCGGGGPNNFNLSKSCGEKGMVLCDDPSRYISWDGLHLTEAAYSIIADGLLEGPFTSPPIGSMCVQKRIDH